MEIIIPDVFNPLLEYLNEWNFLELNVSIIRSISIEPPWIPTLKSMGIKILHVGIITFNWIKGTLYIFTWHYAQYEQVKLVTFHLAAVRKK